MDDYRQQMADFASASGEALINRLSERMNDTLSALNALFGEGGTPSETVSATEEYSPVVVSYFLPASVVSSAPALFSPRTVASMAS